MNKLRKVLTYFIPVIGCFVLIWIFFAPEISHYFKNRGVPTEGDLQRSAIDAFDKFELSKMSEKDANSEADLITGEPGWTFVSGDDGERTKFSETGNSNFPYSMNYRVILKGPDKQSLMISEVLYLYNGEWIRVSEKTGVLQGDGIKELSNKDFIY